MGKGKIDEFMKRIVTTASMMVLGAASLHAVYAPELSRLQSGKPWTVSAALRGFYDDNWNCWPDDQPLPEGTKRESWGFEARPYIGLNFPMEAGSVSLSYLNTSRYYEARAEDRWDFSHDFNLDFEHAFSPRYRLSVLDNVTIATEPTVNGSAANVPFKTDQSYIRNLANIHFAGDLTRQTGFTVAYMNGFYDYSGKNPYSLVDYSTSLNRLEHLIPVELNYQVQPTLLALIGYQFGLNNYTGDGQIDPANNPDLMSDDRDSMGHYVYAGMEYDITATLHTALRGGAQYSDYLNVSGSDQWTPYVDASLSYTYTAGSHLTFGYRQTMAATDVTASDGTRPTLDMETSVFYLLIQHQFTPKLNANLLTQYQYSTYHGGAYNNDPEQLLMLGLYFNYMLNQHLSLEAGYNYNLLLSDVQDEGGVSLRNYDRNILYLGVRATY
jgi:hypothetical protein